MKRKIQIATLGFIFLAAFAVQAPAQKKDTTYTMGIVQNGDTIIHRNIPEIVILPQHDFKNPRQERKYNRYILRVKKVFPYAKLAGELLRKYEPEYMALDNDRDRRRMMKSLEKQLLDEYKDDMKRMTISEGHILIKLIDRETAKTSYSLIKDFRGGVPAVFWQGITRLFGSNLKTEFDPYGEDRLLEEIVTLIEIGYL